MSAADEIAPQLHARMFNIRAERDDIRRLAVRLAQALEAEIDLRHGLGHEGEVRRRSARVLLEARQRGLL